MPEQEEHDGALLIATPTQHATHILSHTLTLIEIEIALHKIDGAGKQSAPQTATFAICFSFVLYFGLSRWGIWAS